MNSTYFVNVAKQAEEAKELARDQFSSQKSVLDNYMVDDNTYTKQEHMAFMKYADANADGYLSYAERNNAMNKLNANVTEQNKLKALYSATDSINSTFAAVNKDGKNDISKDEFVTYCKYNAFSSCG
jgi:Ca2+-binding EF-hand superfamily protein